MEAIVPIASALVVGILALAVALVGRKRPTGKYKQLLRQGTDWRQVRCDDQLWQQVRALREFASSRGLQDHFHMAGGHRGARFEVVHYRRPPELGQRTFSWGVAVLLPRPDRGPELRLARTGVFGRLGKELAVPLGDPEFDRTYLLTSQDADYARRAVPTGLARELLADGRMRDVVVEFAPNHLVAFRGGPATAEIVLPMLDLLTEISSSVPWRELAK